MEFLTCCLISFSRKNKPRPVKGRSLVNSLLVRYPNNWYTHNLI